MNQQLIETNPVKLLLRNESMRKRFEEVLKDKAAPFMASLTSLSSKGPLRECKPESVVAAAFIAATLDLAVDPSLGFAWIVPFKGLAVFILGAKGYVQLAARTGQYRTIGACPVPEGVFRKWNPLSRVLELDWDAKESDKTVGYAAHFKLMNGYEQNEYWSIEKVERHAQRFSQSYKKGTDSPWKSDFDAMGTKTVLKSLLSHWGILSIQMEKAILHDNGSSIDIDSEVVHPDAPEPGDDEGSPPTSTKKITKLQAAKDKMAADKKASEPQPSGPVDTLEDELTALKEEIQAELLARSSDEDKENSMRMLCRVASHYQGKYFELAQLKVQREIPWLRHTLAEIKKANATSAPAEPERMREPGEDEVF